jgi:hypothetical protein
MSATVIHVPYLIEDVALYIDNGLMSRECKQYLVTIDLAHLVAVVAHEVQFRPHEADGAIRHLLTLRAAKRNAFGHGLPSDGHDIPIDPRARARAVCTGASLQVLALAADHAFEYGESGAGLRAIELTGADGLCAGGEAVVECDIAHPRPGFVGSGGLDDLFDPVGRDENPRAIDIRTARCGAEDVPD